MSTGAIYYNFRCHLCVDHRRRIAWSFDGGAFFVDWQVAEDLFEVGEPFYSPFAEMAGEGPWLSAGRRTPQAVRTSRPWVRAGVVALP